MKQPVRNQHYDPRGPRGHGLCHRNTTVIHQTIRGDHQEKEMEKAYLQKDVETGFGSQLFISPTMNRMVDSLRAGNLFLDSGTSCCPLNTSGRSHHPGRLHHNANQSLDWTGYSSYNHFDESPQPGQNGVSLAEFNPFDLSRSLTASAADRIDGAPVPTLLHPQPLPELHPRQRIALTLRQ